ncbi:MULTISPECIES: 2Fe-2S iron-sulfur cluster-binding protein [Spongiibacter]|uniref:2Fe-2S iron-sulfur cluster binding domain-containing protein n=2 Tax=Spongiibacter TaxID=630749 RepID=A0ABX1GI73_9GAMM|nr:MULTISPECIES: 2Fe-2S iron-sulfur cluster-binding protein [Spongiibacter]NKI18601.1 2Fe-2S iron-sulfur cluster binding domain-containing protein [Spongiibacter thalassae]|tara:strand:+ start:16885 stop:17976 length:1092 start_codon:yes stop_codon:yes gene_type:complete
MSTRGFQPLTISSVQKETDSAVVIGFNVEAQQAELYKYRPGQYLTLRANIDGESVQRSYSICSGINDAAMTIAVKRVEGGKFSNFANDALVAGAQIEVMPPQGNFCADISQGNRKNYLFIASGSGITPILSNIKSILDVESNSRLTLIYGNKRTTSIMFRDALSFLKNQYLTRFQWINILSREDQGVDLLNGRIDNAKGRALGTQLIDLKSYDEYYICGPESMISEVSRGLRGLGIEENSIRYELFGASADDASAVIEKHHARANAYAGKTSEVTVIFDGRGSSFDLAADGENILDAGMSHGMDLPYSCKGGVCSTCKALLVEGEVDQDITHGLEESDLKRGYILTCQAHPISEKVVVNFDEK